MRCGLQRLALQKHSCQPEKPSHASHKTILCVSVDPIRAIVSNLLNLIIEMSKIETLLTISQLVYLEMKAYYRHEDGKQIRIQTTKIKQIWWAPVLFVSTRTSIHHAFGGFFFYLTDIIGCQLWVAAGIRHPFLFKQLTYWSLRELGVIFKIKSFILFLIGIYRSPYVDDPIWMPWNFTGDKSTLIHVIPWYHAIIWANAEPDLYNPMAWQYYNMQLLKLGYQKICDFFQTIKSKSSIVFHYPIL